MGTTYNYYYAPAYGAQGNTEYMAHTAGMTAMDKALYDHLVNTTEDHTQYVLLNGRSSGQTIYGGTAASESLYLYSTYHLTKGSIYIGSSFILSAGTIAATGDMSLSGDAVITGDTIIYGSTISLTGVTTLSGGFTVYGTVALTGNTSLSGNAVIAGDATIYGSTISLTGSTTLSGDTAITGDFTVDGSTISLTGSTALSGDAAITGDFTVYGSTISLTGTTTLSGNAIFTGDTTLSGSFIVGSDTALFTIPESGNVTIQASGTSDTGLNINNQILRLNADYSSGDEDAWINFNANSALFKYEYAGSKGNTEFSLNERIYIDTGSVTTSAGNFDSEKTSYALRAGGTYNFASWDAAAYGYSALGAFFQVDNQINETCAASAEVAVGEFQAYMLSANSKAPQYGVDVLLYKGLDCETANYLIGTNVIIASDVAPGAGNWMNGTGFRAASQSMGSITGVQQHTAYLAHGAAGWAYGFLYVSTDDSTVLSHVNSAGTGYLATGLDLGGDIGSGSAAGTLRLVNSVTPWNNGTGVTGAKAITGAVGPTFGGYIKIYVAETPAWVPYYTNIRA